jgi:hypothetical protein
MGQGSQANGINSFASGEGCLASDLATTAMGYYSMATNSGGSAIGVFAVAGQNAVALGAYASAGGEYSSALGNYVYANGYQSTAIGYGSLANGITAMALGNLCVANGKTSTAMGYSAEADHTGAFVWADTSSDNLFQSTGDNQFLIRASGGVGINTPDPLGNALCVSGDARVDAQPAAWNEGLAINCPTNMVAGGGFGGIHFHSTGPGQGFSPSSIKWSEMYNYAPEIGNAVGGGLAFIRNNSSTSLYLSPDGNVGIGSTGPLYRLEVAGNCGATTFVTTSDRNAKEHFQSVNPQEVLNQVAALPLSRWNYKEDKTQQHIGPMAQDFYAAFGLGPDDKHITTVDEGGVALAAIQGLNQKLEAGSQKLREANAALKAKNDSLEARLERLELLLQQASK